MKLLLIEDDQAYQLAMATHLRQLAGVQEVWVAEDGELGLELLGSKPVDLVLLDLVLPGLGGLATCRRITVNTALPVLILTSQEDTGWVRQIWDAGARGYLHKERALAQVELALASLKGGPVGGIRRHRRLCNDRVPTRPSRRRSKVSCSTASPNANGRCWPAWRLATTTAPSPSSWGSVRAPFAATCMCCSRSCRSVIAPRPR